MRLDINHDQWHHLGEWVCRMDVLWLMLWNLYDHLANASHVPLILLSLLWLHPWYPEKEKKNCLIVKFTSQFFLNNEMYKHSFLKESCRHHIFKNISKFCYYFINEKYFLKKITCKFSQWQSQFGFTKLTKMCFKSG